MIGNHFDGVQWGGNIKARNAANKRFIELKEQGYDVYWAQKKIGLVGTAAYTVLAFGDQEDFDNVKPALPEQKTFDRRLNARTVHIGMQVAVEHVQGEEIDGHHNRRGVVKGVMLEDEGLAVAYVQFRDDPHVHTKIEVFRLRQVPK